MIKTCGKDKEKKKSVDKEIEKLEADLKAKHKKQMEEFDFVEEEKPIVQIIDATPNKEEMERLKKKEKSIKKNQKKMQKDEDLRKKTEENLRNGLSDRQKELQVIQKQLITLGLIVKTIPSDGHCLYRSISDQIFPDDKEGYLVLRKMVAKDFREHPEEYMPYLEGFNGDVMEESKIQSRISCF